MAVTTTARLGLNKYSSGADPHPTRAEFNTQQDKLEQLVALAAQGTLSARPAAGKWGRAYFATDNSRLYWDTGAAWVEVSNVGGGGAGAALAIGGAGSEGSSNRAARADHTHPLPLATASVNGAMAAADKAKLDAAKVSATASTLVVRDTAGRAQFSSPAADGDAANKAYVDQQMSAAASASHTHPWSEITGKPTTYAPSAHTHPWTDLTGVPSTFAPAAHTHSATDLTSGVLAAARLPAASSTVAGAMSTAHWSLLNGAVSTATASRLALRDANGRIQVGTPAVDADASTKAYVDSQVATRALETHTHPWSQITGAPATYAPSAHTHAWSELTGVPSGLTTADTSATGNTLALRNSNGNFSVADPTSGSHAATKSYVDSAIVGVDRVTSNVNGDYLRVTGDYLGYWGGSGWKVAFDRVKGEMYVGTVPWGSVTGKPSSFSPSSHTHSGGDITSGIVRYGSIRGTEGVHDYAVSGSVPGTSYAVWVDGQGKFGRNTSSIRYKGDVQDAALDPAAVLHLQPRTYYRKGEDGELVTHVPRELGLIAEEVDQHLPQVVIRDNEGRVDGIRYDLLTVPLLTAVQDLARRVQDLEGDR